MKDKTHLIPEGWNEMTLGETVNIIDGDRGSNYPKNNELLSNGFCLFLSTKNVPNTSFCFDEVKFINEKVHSKLRKGKLEKNDFVLTTRGTIGNFAYFSENTPYDHIRINSGMVVLRAKKELLENGFLEFFLKSGFFRKQVYSFSSGTAQPQLPIKDLRYIKMLLPPLPEQKAIAEVLSSFDNKIELLREQNKTLEAFAQTIFNEWFVRFNFPDENGKPYQASGGKMIDSELGIIPEGWRVGQLGEYVSHNRELINPSNNPDILYNHYSIPSFDNNKIHEKTYGDKILSGKYLLPLNCFLVSKLNPKMPRIWQILEAKENSICSTEFQVIIVKNRNFYSLIYSILTSENFTLVFASKAKGTSSSHQRSNPQDIFQHKMVLPTNQVIEMYNSFLMPFLLKIETNNSQIQTLSSIRDELLPKLMKGELRARNSEGI